MLDTHAYFWWVSGDDQLSSQVADLIRQPDTEVLISAVVVWELATKARIGKWPDAETVLDGIQDALMDAGLSSLPVSLEHARRASGFLWPHKDPFDRLLGAQTEIERATLAAADPIFRAMGIDVVW